MIKAEDTSAAQAVLTRRRPTTDGGHARLGRPALVGAAVLTAAAIAAAAAAVVSSEGPGTPGPTSIPAPAQPPPAGEQFGVNVGRLFNDGAYTTRQIDAQLAALAQTGATVARADALWERSELRAPVGDTHRYDWSFDDRIASSLAARGLRWLPIIDYSASWAQSVPGEDHSPPSSTAAYAAYAAAVAARYGPGGTFWSLDRGGRPQPVDTFEIWNEPDNAAFWKPGPDPAAYGRLYAAARNAILSVDPGARVIVGGLTHPASFLPAMLAADPVLRGRIDGVAIHPYGASPDAVLTGVRAARATLNELGLEGVPLYVTEFGWTTAPPGALDYAPESRRPGYIERTLAALGHLDCGVAAALLYAWVTPERDPANPQDWFGIHPPGGGLTPDVAALSAGLRVAAAAAPRIDLCGGAVERRGRGGG